MSTPKTPDPGGSRLGRTLSGWKSREPVRFYCWPLVGFLLAAAGAITARTGAFVGGADLLTAAAVLVFLAAGAVRASVFSPATHWDAAAAVAKAVAAGTPAAVAAWDPDLTLGGRK